MSQPLTLTLARRAPRTAQIFGSLLVAALLVLPFLALLPATHPLAVSTWMLTLIGKILCYAVVAVALDLVWGYAGMLSLGHGIFFALGGYAMGMYLMRQAAGDGLPAFMSFLSWSELPWFWWGTQHFAWALVLIVTIPGLLALVFGWFAFRSKIKGVYFSIMTQALTYAGMLLFFRNETGFGGNNGFTGFTTLLGFSVTATTTRIALFLATVVLLLLVLGLLSKPLQLVTKLPVIHGANAVGGGALGLLWGALVVFVVVWALRKFDILLTPETVEQSRLLRFFAEHSPLDWISGL